MLEDFGDFEIEEVEGPEKPKKRAVCKACERPESVCFCSSITPITTRHTIIMLQHPMELRRVLRTTKILELSLPVSNYHLFRGKRFMKTHFRELYKILKIDVFDEGLVEDDPNVENVLVYPSDSAVPISTLSPSKTYRIIFIDGTWAQARTMYNTNPILQGLKAVKIDQELLDNTTSKYVIRTQPKDICVSTVEAAALVLSQLERKEIYDQLTDPLTKICDFQLENGAQAHHSKEYQLANGLYKKQINNGNRK